LSVAEVVLPFTPRPWQLPLLDDNKPKIVAVVHRRAGKSTAIIWRGLRKALTWDRSHIAKQRRNMKADPPRVVHVLPQGVMWSRTGLWDKLASAARAIPNAKIEKSDRRIVLPNGGIYQAGGMDNPDAWRGGYADEVIEDEADDVTAEGLDMVVEPMLADFSGTRLKVGTPKGNGRLQDAYERAGSDPDASRYLLSWQETGVFTAEQVARLRTELDEDEFAQELEVSFAAPNSGAYFAKSLDEAERAGRICNVPYDPTLPLYTSWDLGIDDSTAIWFFQITRSGEWRWLEYFEESGAGLDFYVKELKARPYIYTKHYLPHDIEVRELTFGGRSRRQFLDGHGLKPIVVVPACNPAERISAARIILPKCWFNAPGCARGLKMLRSYKREWNEQAGIWRSNPVHDFSSHCADAFGTGIQGAQEPGNERKMVKLPTRPSLVGQGVGWMR
jgi:phage terminase large subunit